MSNVNAPFGLRPLRMLNGCTTFALGEYNLASGLSSSLLRGDPIKLTGTGKNIDLAAAGDTAVGVFAGVKYIDANCLIVFSNYWPGGTATFNADDATVFVWDSPDIVFEIQADTLAKANVGALCDWVAGTGSTITQTSGAYAEGSATATSGKGLRIIGLKNAIDNEYGAYAKLEVMFAEHTLRGVTSGAGGV